MVRVPVKVNPAKPGPFGPPNIGPFGPPGGLSRTPIASRTNPEEPATRPSAPPPAASHRALFLGFGAGLTVVLLAFGLAYFLGPRSRPFAPEEAPVALPKLAPVAPALLPPVVATPTPPLVAAAPQPPRQTPPVVVSPAPEATPPPAPEKPDKKKKAPAVRKHPSAKPTPAAPVVAPDGQKEPPAPKQVPSGAPGTLVLIVNPAGDVLIDGKLQRKQEGRAEYPLPPGKHQVEVRGPSNWRKEIVVEPSQKTWEWAYR